MVDQLFSQGMLAFVGVPGRLSAKSPEDCVVDVAGDAALDLLPRIKAILDGLHAADPPLWQAATVAEIGRRAEAWLRAHHPELSDEAITAVSNHFAFEWK
jgi:hypothetical protein